MHDEIKPCCVSVNVRCRDFGKAEGLPRPLTYGLLDRTGEISCCREDCLYHWLPRILRRVLYDNSLAPQAYYVFGATDKWVLTEAGDHLH